MDTLFHLQFSLPNNVYFPFVFLFSFPMQYIVNFLDTYYIFTWHPLAVLCDKLSRTINMKKNKNDKSESLYSLN